MPSFRRLSHEFVLPLIAGLLTWIGVGLLISHVLIQERDLERVQRARMGALLASQLADARTTAHFNRVLKEPELGLDAQTVARLRAKLPKLPVAARAEIQALRVSFEDQEKQARVEQRSHQKALRFWEWLILLLAAGCVVLFFWRRLPRLKARVASYFDRLDFAERESRILWQSSSSGIWLIDAEGCTLGSNAVLEEMLGCSKEELLSRPWTDFKLQPDTTIPRSGSDLELQLLRRDGAAFTAGLRFFACGERTLVLVSDLSRIQGRQFSLHLEEVNLDALVTEIVARFDAEAALAGSPIEVRLASGRPVSGLWDRERLEQVLTHLLSNAIKHGQGHPIEITVGSPETSGLAYLSVKDRGVGIAASEQPRVFEMSEGLGLYIVSQIVQAHGGRIKLQSELGQGSTFLVELPLIAASAGLTREIDQTDFGAEIEGL